jgi:hypothetical protein
MVEASAGGGLSGESEERDVQLVADRLASEFGQDRSEVERQVRDAYGRWDDATVRTFVPIMVERRVREELKRAS